MAERCLRVLNLNNRRSSSLSSELFAMFIHEMTDQECRTALQKARVGRLGCARNNQPYIVPVYFGFDGKYIYGFTTVGQKSEWMRINPKVCLEIDERISEEKWTSVIVFGHYEELPDEPRYEAARLQAHEVLRLRPMWWEPAFMSDTHRDTSHSVVPVFYRIHIGRMTGHRATGDIVEGGEPAPLIGKEGWIESLLRHIGMKN
jgi:nitroimidazol reductase NimA-like FMN-containing flavoprotein (pyridoxamine 5'-phosphate oxidase superfamily)